VNQAIEDIQANVAAALKQLKAGEGDDKTVHHVRTGLRRLEAFGESRLPKRLRKLRKESGKVRDLDVLMQLSEKLTLSPDQKATLRKRAEKVRKSEAKRLRKLAKRVQPKKLRKWAEKHASGQSAQGADLIGKLEWVLADPKYQELDERNLHDFRLALKPLRYRSEAAKEGQAAELAQFIHAAQSKAGDWHDWQMLQGFAREILGAEAAAVSALIELELARTYREAQRSAIELRTHFQETRAAAA